MRVSGPGALSLARSLTQTSSFSPRHATLCSLFDAAGALIDEALVLYFQAPKSFTGEEVVEFQCHGGMMVASMVLEALVHQGARLATPGEFSKRAFLNGRIDLAEAEAIAHLIEAKSEEAAKILARQMKGELSRFVYEAREALLEILAYVEVSIDYAEEDLPQDLVRQMEAKLARLEQQLLQIVTVSQQRKGLMQGFKVAIVGKPNVGKSSLLNGLLQYDRAIISDVAGTTRDTIEEQMRIGTHLIKIVDTAGIRHTEEAVEQIGIARSKKAIEEADIVLALFDASRPKDAEDEEILALLTTYASSKHLIYVLNKTDLPCVFHGLEDALHVSTFASLQSIVDTLKAYLDTQRVDEGVLLTSAHQIASVQKAYGAIKEATPRLHEAELELFAFHLHEAINGLGAITRPYGVDEMLDKMFGTFCLGK